MVWRANGDQAEINRTPGNARRKFTREAADARLAARIARRIRGSSCPPSLPPMAPGMFGYMGYDTVRLMERLPEPNPDPLGIPDAHPHAPDGDGDLRQHQGRDHHRLAGAAAEAGVPAESAYTRARRPAEGRRRRARPAAQHTPPANGGKIDCPKPTSNTTPGEYRGDGEEGEGVHRRRRHLPGGAQPALLGALHLPPFALYRALRRTNPSPFLYLSRFRRLRRRRLQPRNPGARPRGRGDHPADRRHAPPRRQTPRRTSGWRKTCSPTRRSAPST